MHAISRICGLCHKAKPALGSRMRSILGRRTWVCMSCVEKTK